MSFRSFLYRLASLLGDVNAVKRRRIGKRLVNKAIGRGIVSRIWWK